MIIRFVAFFLSPSLTQSLLWVWVEECSLSTAQLCSINRRQSAADSSAMLDNLCRFSSQKFTIAHRMVIFVLIIILDVLLFDWGFRAMRLAKHIAHTHQAHTICALIWCLFRWNCCKKEKKQRRQNSMRTEPGETERKKSKRRIKRIRRKWRCRRWWW